MDTSMGHRWIALDILRGLSVIGMLLIINPGAWDQRYSWLNHVEWAGIVHADMIFPTFLFCVGMALPISIARRFSGGANKQHLFLHILWRSVALIFVGILLNAFPSFHWEDVRIPGVLQRIGLCYGLVASLVLCSSHGRDIYVRPLIIASTLILLGYWFLLANFAAPEIAAPAYDSVNSLPAYIDRQLFGLQHMWPYGTTGSAVTYDPEGVLSTLPACVNVILGVVATLVFQREPKVRAASIGLIVGLAFVVLALVWNQWFPIIKKIWTSSFVLFSSGVSIIAFVCIDFLLKNIHAEKFLYVIHVFGANALLAFIVAGVIGPLMDMSIGGSSIRADGFNWLQHIVVDPKGASFLYSFIVVSLIFLLMNFFYQRQWFLKL
ncbi:MAG TPA: DUF5009 domain-containing protein [Cellvibrionaceae bacterium]